MHALIIEPDAWIALMIEDILLEMGFGSSAVVTTTEAAVEALRAQVPDLITSGLPVDARSGIDAWEDACPDKAIPIVFVTCLPGEVRAVLPDALVVAKPFAKQALKEAVSLATALDRA